MKLTARLATNEDFISCKKFDDRITETLYINMIENDQIFIALVNDIIVGYLRIEFIWLKIPYLSWLFVTPKVRKQGCATQLVQYLHNHLKNSGYEFLISSYQSNAPHSQSFHKKLGFKECGRIDGLNKDNSSELFCKITIKQ